MGFAAGVKLCRKGNKLVRLWFGFKNDEIASAAGRPSLWRVLLAGRGGSHGPIGQSTVKQLTLPTSLTRGTELLSAIQLQPLSTRRPPPRPPPAGPGS